MTIQKKIGTLIIASIVLLSSTVASAQRIKTDMITAISWSLDNQRLAVGADNGELVIRAVRSGENLLTLIGHTDRVLDIAWSPDGARIASVAADETIRIWDSATGKLLSTFTKAFAINAVTWTPDGSKIITGSVEDPEFSTRVRDAKSGETLLGRRYGAVGEFVWSPDQTKLGILSGYQITIVDLKTFDQIIAIRPKEERPLGTNRFDFSHMAWHPDGHIIATGNNSGMVRTWDITSGTMLLDLKANDVIPSPGKTNYVVGLSFNTNGKKLIALSEDGTLRVWDSGTGKVLNTKIVARGPIAFSGANWSQYQARLAIGQNMATALQIIVPVADVDELEALVKRCARADLQASLLTQVDEKTLPTFVAEIKKLNADQIPLACAADLIAVAEALQVAR